MVSIEVILHKPFIIINVYYYKLKSFTTCVRAMFATFFSLTSVFKIPTISFHFIENYIDCIWHKGHFAMAQIRAKLQFLK